MTSLLLDRTNWDLCVDANGNIAACTEPYSVAQDVATACRLFLGELWFDTTKGVPYWSAILGMRPPLAFVKAQIVIAALTVPDVVTARCIIVAFQGRAISGQVQVIDTSGQQQNVQF